MAKKESRHDQTDLSILSFFSASPSGTITELAKLPGLTRVTVSNRIARLKLQRVFKRGVVVVDPSMALTIRLDLVINLSQAAGQDNQQILSGVLDAVGKLNSTDFRFSAAYGAIGGKDGLMLMFHARNRESVYQLGITIMRIGIFTSVDVVWLTPIG